MCHIKSCRVENRFRSGYYLSHLCFFSLNYIIYHRIGHDRIWQTCCQKLSPALCLHHPCWKALLALNVSKTNTSAFALRLMLSWRILLPRLSSYCRSVFWSFSASRCTLITDVIVWSWPLHPAKLCQQDAEFSVALRECTCCDAEKHPVETPVPLNMNTYNIYIYIILYYIIL